MIITITLSADSLPGLDVALLELGLTVRHRPLLRFIDRPDDELRSSLKNSGRFGAIVVTSPRASVALGRALPSSVASDFPVVWAAGPATQAALPSSLASRTPVVGSGAIPLAAAMIANGVRGPVLYLCSSDRRDELPEQLRANGIEVEETPGYDVELAEEAAMLEALQDTDLVLIASHRVLREAARLHSRPGLISLGPATARTALEVGWTPAAVASSPTVNGVIEAIQSLVFAAPGPQSSPSNPSSGR